LNYAFSLSNDPQTFHYAAGIYHDLFPITKQEDSLKKACEYISIASKISQAFEVEYIHMHFALFDFYVQSQEKDHLDAAKLVLEKLIYTSSTDDFIPYLIRLNWIQIQVCERESNELAKPFLSQIVTSTIDRDSSSLIKVEEVLHLLKDEIIDFFQIHSIYMYMEFENESLLRGHILYHLFVNISDCEDVPEPFLRDILWNIWVDWVYIFQKKQAKIILQKPERFLIRVFLGDESLIFIADVRIVAFALVDLEKRDSKMKLQLVSLLKKFLSILEQLDQQNAFIISDMISCYEYLLFISPDDIDIDQWTNLIIDLYQKLDRKLT
jgi:hypothetical protein